MGQNEKDTAGFVDILRICVQCCSPPLQRRATALATALTAALALGEKERSQIYGESQQNQQGAKSESDCSAQMQREITPW
jgi:hypothetical protein